MDPKSWFISEIYQAHSTSKESFINVIGYYSTQDGFSGHPLYIWDRRKNFGNATLAVGSCGRLHKEKYLGLMDVLAEAANFNYNVIECPNGLFGGMVNGTPVGMVGLLFTRELDLVADELTISKTRLEIIDYSIPNYKSHSKSVPCF